MKSRLRFYEKVIKVKADVAALHIFFSHHQRRYIRVAWRAVKGTVLAQGCENAWLQRLRRAPEKDSTVLPSCDVGGPTRESQSSTRFLGRVSVRC